MATGTGPMVAVCNTLEYPLRSFIEHTMLMRRDPTWLSGLLREAHENGRPDGSRPFTEDTEPGGDRTAPRWFLNMIAVEVPGATIGHVGGLARVDFS